MPIYAFRCPECGLDFDVSRKMSEVSDDALCPIDGSKSQRVYTVPVAPGSPFARAVRAVTRGGAWSHFGHSHDAGTSQHTH